MKPKPEDLTWLAELPAHELRPTDALYLVDSLVPVAYRCTDRQGDLTCDELGGNRVFHVKRRDLAIREGISRKMPSGQAAVVPQPAAPNARSTAPLLVSAPKPNARPIAPLLASPPAPIARPVIPSPAPVARPVPVAQKPPVSGGSTTATPTRVEVNEAQTAALDAARKLSEEIVRVQAQAAAEGQALSPAAALQVLRSRGLVPTAPGSR